MSKKPRRVLRPRTHTLVEAAVERGLVHGYQRAEKYAVGKPTREAILEHCEREVMNALSEDFKL